MKTRLPKVLMLGWEFPPLINGGLGVACHNLSAAMSDMADITMLVPRSSPSFRMKNVNLVGINNLDLSRYANYPSNYRKPLPFKIVPLAADLDPYYSESETKNNSLLSGFRRYFTDGSSESENLYGGDMIGRVIKYGEIASQFAEGIDFDVIHAHDWMTMIAGMMIREETGKPLVMHIHSLEVDRSGPESRGWVYELEKQGMAAADLLLPVSNFTSRNITEHYGINPAKIRVVHNGSTTAGQPAIKRKPLGKTVLFVGRITRQKGPEIFLDIASKVTARDPEVRFVMAGTGDNFRRCIETSSYRGIGNRFHMTGFLDGKNLNSLYAMSDVYCMPSVSEPFGLSAVEAAQSGVPCVISKQSGVSEVLRGALKFDHWDVDRASGYILNLLHDNTLRERVRDDAKRDLKEINWKKSALGVVTAYRDKNLIYKQST